MPNVPRFRSSRPVRLALLLAVGFVWLAPAAAAQEPSPWAGLQPVPPLPALTLPAVFTVPPIAAKAASEARARPPLLLAVPARRPPVLVPLYFSFAGLQTLDAVSTLRALDEGHGERNPLVGWLAGHPGALVAAKAGVAAGTVYLSERLWKKNRKAAIVLMVALNGAYAAIVANNHGAVR